MNAKEILLAAASAVEANPKSWIKGTAARDVNGDFVEQDSPKAVCWCAIGFINRYDFTEPKERFHAREVIRNLTDNGSIVEHNDKVINTPEEFIVWFRKAADLL